MTERPTTAYKVLTSEEMETLERDGVFQGAPVDLADGFIHLSTASQTPATAERFFEKESLIFLVKIDREKLEAGPGELKWEDSKSHGVFAHLYGADIEESAVLHTYDFEKVEGENWGQVLKSGDEWKA